MIYQWNNVLVLIADGVFDRMRMRYLPAELVLPPGDAPVTLGFDPARRLGFAKLHWLGVVDLVADIRFEAGIPDVERLLRADLKKVWPCVQYRRLADRRQFHIEAVVLTTNENADPRVQALGTM